MLHRLLLLFLCALLAVAQPVLAADVGVFVRPAATDVSSPLAGKSWVFSSNDKRLYYYDGSAWQVATLPKSNLSATVNPGVSDDGTAGYLPGSVWFNTSTHELFLCSSSATGAAVWEAQSNRISLNEIKPKLTTADLFSDWAVSGFASAVPVSSLSLTTPSGIAYVNGSRLSVSSSAYTYTASKDTYDYLQSDGTYIHPSVNNGNTAPTGQPGVLVQKVVTNGSAITAITKLIPSLPQLNVANAGSSNNAVNLAQADARYSPISAYNFLNTPIADNYFYRAPSGGGIVQAGPITTADLPTVPTTKGGLGASNSAPYDKILVGLSGSYGEIAAPSGANQLLSSASGFTGTGGISDFAYVPNLLAGASAPTSGQIPIGGAGSTFLSKSVSGDLTIDNLGVATLPTVNSNVGSFTNVNLTVDGKGRITAAANGSAAAIKFPSIAKSANFTANDTSGTFYQVTASSAIAVTLPASPADGTTYLFKRVSGTGVITLTANGAETIDCFGDVATTLAFDNTGVMQIVAVTGGWRVTS